MVVPADAPPSRSRFRRWVLLNALLLGLVGLASLTYPVDELSRRAGDLYFRLRAPEPASDQVALVLIDDASLEQYGRWPWPRSLLAKLVRETSAHHPRALGLDILLSEPEDEPSDRDLAAAFREAGKIVLAAKIGSASQGQNWVEPLPLFAHNAAGIGHVQAELGPDGICRRVPTFEMTAEGPRPALALELARFAGQEKTTLPGLSPQAQTITPQFLIVDFRGQIGPESSPFPFVSAADLLQGKAGNQLKDRAVLIGFASTEIADRLPTPVSGQSPMPGVEVHANLVDELLAGRELKPLPAGIEILLLALVSMVLTGVVLRRPGWTGPTASGVLTLLGYLGGYALFDHYQRLISFGPFLCLGVLAAPLAQLENLLEVDRGLTRSLRQLEAALHRGSPVGAANLRGDMRPEGSKADLHWKVATVNR
jgi:CHASE2 domain-containing sensor protein